MQAILSSYRLTDIEQADRNLQAMAGGPPERRQLADILPILLDSIARTADPDQALNHWERMLSNVTRSSFLDYLHSSPRMLDLLCTIFGNSDALAFTIIRDPTLVYWLAEEDVLSRPPTRKGIEQSLHKQLSHLTVKELKLEVLRRFRRREMLRIGVRDLLRLADVPETTASLSDLAALLIHAAYEIVDADLRRQYGVPMHKRQGKWVETGFAVMGMGKLGGRELNYSSDVDLIYVYASHDGETRASRGKRMASRQRSAFPMKNTLKSLARADKGLGRANQGGLRVSRGLASAGGRYGWTAGALTGRLPEILLHPRPGLGTVGAAQSLASSRFDGGRAILLEDGKAVCVWSRLRKERSRRCHGHCAGRAGGQRDDRCEDGRSGP